MQIKRIVIKTGEELDSSELDAVNKSKKREWDILPMDSEQQLQSTFFLLKDNTGKVLAQGQVISIEGVKFNNQMFNILGIGGIIANSKGKGNGLEIMLAIKDYLTKQNKTGVGFTGVPGFYQKCGFSIDKTSLHRFIHIVDGKKVTNTSDEYVLYYDSEDLFMESVLDHPDKEVYLPRNPDW